MKDTGLIIEYFFISRDVDEYRYSLVPEEIFENVEKKIKGEKIDVCRSDLTNFSPH